MACGVSQYQGRERCNDFSIGIELEAPIRWRIPMRSINSLRRLRGTD